MMNKPTKLHFIMILVLAATYNAIYSLAFMKGLYYNLMQAGLGLTHFKLGQLYSFYGAFSMVSYLCGAFFLQKFKYWKLIAFSSFFIGILTVALVLLPSYPVMLAIFGIIGFLLGAVFYPSQYQILLQIGHTSNQESVFSLFFVFNNLLGILFSILGFGITSICASDTQLVRLLFLLFASLNIIFSILSAVFLSKLPEDCTSHAPVSIKETKKLLCNQKLWLVIIIVFTNYIAFSGLNYILPYLTLRYEISSQLNTILTISRTYLIGVIAAPIAGKYTDYLHSASRMIKYTSVINTIVIIFFICFFKHNFFFSVILLFISCMLINMAKSMSLITINETFIPPSLYGIAISFLSFFAYSPDAFYYSISGFLLDTFPYNGYNLLFIITALCTLIGAITSNHLQKI